MPLDIIALCQLYLKYREVLDNWAGECVTLTDKGKPVVRRGRKASWPQKLGFAMQNLWGSRAAEWQNRLFVWYKLNRYKMTMKIFKNENGNAFIEYFVLALVILVATIAFFDQGNFRGAKQSVESAFDNLVEEVLKP